MSIINPHHPVSASIPTEYIFDIPRFSLFGEMLLTDLKSSKIKNKEKIIQNSFEKTIKQLIQILEAQKNKTKKPKIAEHIQNLKNMLSLNPNGPTTQSVSYFDPLRRSPSPHFGQPFDSIPIKKPNTKPSIDVLPLPPKIVTKTIFATNAKLQKPMASRATTPAPIFSSLSGTEFKPVSASLIRPISQRASLSPFSNFAPKLDNFKVAAASDFAASPPISPISPSQSKIQTPASDSSSRSGAETPFKEMDFSDDEQTESLPTPPKGFVFNFIL